MKRTLGWEGMLTLTGGAWELRIHIVCTSKDLIKRFLFKTAMGKEFVLILALHWENTAGGWREGRMSTLTHSPCVEDMHKNL